MLDPDVEAATVDVERDERLAALIEENGALKVREYGEEARSCRQLEEPAA